jgi:pimeloyl-ACP methyl ester carboxylesterase
MTSPPPTPHQHLRRSDLRATAQLLTEATRQVTQVVEGMHRSVFDRIGLPGAATPGRTRGITGWVYRSIDGVAAGVGAGADVLLAGAERWLPPAPDGPDSPQRLALRSVLNGVMGDRLAAQGNPLALPMQLVHGATVLDPSAPLQVPGAQGRLLIVLHGLCMNDQQWTTTHKGQVTNHGQTLAQAMGATPLFLRYNSGRHIADNGLELARQLEQLVQRWPVPVSQITLMGHSMGGLVARSAVFAAQQAGLAWPARLRHLVTLGTPHHGAPLERAGQWVHTVLGALPHTAPLATLARLRSAGITDLRHGRVRDDTSGPSDRFAHGGDERAPLPLPEGVTCCAVAATLASQRSRVAERLLGDGLVPLRSALGQHDNPAHQLAFAPEHQCVLYRTGHLELLASPAVAAQLKRWLA